MSGGHVEIRPIFLENPCPNLEEAIGLSRVKSNHFCIYPAIIRYLSILFLNIYIYIFTLNEVNIYFICIYVFIKNPMQMSICDCPKVKL